MSIQRDPDQLAYADSSLPRSERGHDEQREEFTSGMGADTARPLTDEEQEAGEQDPGRPERVYAPASERVPKPPAPGHEELVEHPDPTTPERRAAGPAGRTAEPTRPLTPPASAAGAGGGPATMSKGERSAVAVAAATPPAPRRAAYRPALPEPEGTDWRPAVAIAAGWLLVGAGVGATVAYLRWRRERNRPVNRLRRRARYAAAYLGDRLPNGEELRGYLPDEDVRPAGGLGLLLLMGALWAVRALRASDSDTDKDEDHRQQHRHGRNGHSKGHRHATAAGPARWAVFRFGRKS